MLHPTKVNNSVIRKYLFLLCISLACSSCSSKANVAATDNKSKATKIKNEVLIHDSIINFGKQYLNTPYRYGGSTPRGFDCSGFTSHVFRNFGYNLGRSSRDQAANLPSISKSNLQTGDLVFFEGNRKNGVIGHVGIVTESFGDGSFKFIHSSTSDGIVVTKSSEPYYASRYLRAGRVIDKPYYYSANKKPVKIEENKDEKETKKLKKQKSSNEKEADEVQEAVYHRVKKGENLSEISKKYDIPVSTLKILNNLSSGRIKHGQRLLVSEAQAKHELRFVHENSEKVLTRNNVTIKNENDKELAKTDISKINTEEDLVKSGLERSATQSELRNKKIAQKSEKNVVSTHKVVKGESLYTIARQNNMSIEELKELNNIKHDNIQPGQILSINKSGKSNRNTAVQKESVSPPRQHTVKKGESLYSIARKFNCSVKELQEWNNVGNSIRPGDKLNIF